MAFCRHSKIPACSYDGRRKPANGFSEIAGVPAETVLAITQAKVWGGGAML